MKMQFKLICTALSYVAHVAILKTDYLFLNSTRGKIF